MTYAVFYVTIRPLKDEEWIIFLVVGGDLLTYEHDSGSPATDFLETKLLFNSVILHAKQGAIFLKYESEGYVFAYTSEES